MSGAFFSVAFTIAIGIAFLALTGIGYFWIVPLVLLGLLGLAFNPVMRGIRDSRIGGPGPTGVPTTKDASYDPQTKP